MSLEPSTCEGKSFAPTDSRQVWNFNFSLSILDLKAFERRLTEVLACLQPNCLRWRILLCIVTLISGISAFFWLRDPQTSVQPFFDSLVNHYIFTLSAVTLVTLFCYGIHKLVISPQVHDNVSHKDSMSLIKRFFRLSSRERGTFSPSSTSAATRRAKSSSDPDRMPLKLWWLTNKKLWAKFSPVFVWWCQWSGMFKIRSGKLGEGLVLSFVQVGLLFWFLILVFIESHVDFIPISWQYNCYRCRNRHHSTAEGLQVRDSNQ